jgi:hypothetical protein
MTKTISQKLREHAMGPLGGSGYTFVSFHLDGYAGSPLLRSFWKEFQELSPFERRMFALFVACALESEQ